jgi:hypothetical protein
MAGIRPSSIFLLGHRAWSPFGLENLMIGGIDDEVSNFDLSRGLANSGVTNMDYIST